MILIAPQPDFDYKANERFYRSDGRQIIYDVEPEDSMALLSSYGCSIPPKAIVCHSFPDGMSIHCFGCGAFLVMPEGENRWFWLRKGEVSIDFPFYHRAHVDWIWSPPKPEGELLGHENPMLGPPEPATLTIRDHSGNITKHQFEPIQPIIIDHVPDPYDEILSATL